MSAGVWGPPPARSRTVAGSAAGSGIRRARVDDLPRIVEIERACFTTPWSLSSFQSLLGRDRVIFLVAEEGPTDLVPGVGRGGRPPRGTASSGEARGFGRGGRGVVGYGVLWAIGEEAELADLAVDPRCRGFGIGGALLDAILRGVEGREVSTVFLEVRESNAAARRLYLGRGFRQVGVRSQYYTRPREDARVLRLDLASGEDACGRISSTPPGHE